MACELVVPEKDMKCPHCGDHMGQWNEYNKIVSELISKGVFFIRENDPLRATLSFFKAVIIEPGNVNALLLLGKILAQQGIFDEAVYYLNKAVVSAQAKSSPEEQEARAALARAKALLDE